MDDLLKLENQLCFPLYAASRLVTKAYQPMLNKLGITYPQYLVLLLLWEDKELSVKEIGNKLYLSSNTLTPLLKRMEDKDLINRERSDLDERIVIISLTKKSEYLQNDARCIPETLAKGISSDFTYDEFIDLRERLKSFIEIITPD